MSALPIVEYPDERLRLNAAEVIEFDDGVKQLTQQLTETLYSTAGIGLCAPQIGQSLRVLIMDLSDDHSACEVFINPQIVAKAGMAVTVESCLSLPGINANVVRSAQLQVKACDANGVAFERELEGMHAVCLQHELDHLNGMLFIDRISKVRAWQFRKALKKLEQLAVA